MRRSTVTFLLSALLFARREPDDMIWVVVFGAAGHINCWGPARPLEHCEKIAESLKPAS